LKKASQPPRDDDVGLPRQRSLLGCSEECAKPLNDDLPHPLTFWINELFIMNLNY